MGNSKLSTKYKVLEILRSKGSSVSGEAIAAETGVSRVSVWKAVQALQNAGYGISSNKSGYFLEKDLKDSLYPWEFGLQEQVFTHFDVTDSTMTEAHRIAESEYSLEDRQERIITADSQSHGQGHNEHSWTTTAGSLACTLITYSHLPVASSHRITMAAQIAMAEVLSAKTGRKFYVRWPNDIWTEKGKAGGILDELSSCGGFCRWINIGIGVNLTNSPDIPGTDCAFVSENHLSRKELLSLFWKEFSIQKQLALESSALLSDKWNSLCLDTGKKVRFLNNAEEAVFTGIDGYGWAGFSSDAEEERRLPPGTISFAKQ